MTVALSALNAGGMPATCEPPMKRGPRKTGKSNPWRGGGGGNRRGEGGWEPEKQYTTNVTTGKEHQTRGWRGICLAEKDSAEGNKTDSGAQDGKDAKVVNFPLDSPHEGDFTTYPSYPSYPSCGDPPPAQLSND